MSLLKSLLQSLTTQSLPTSGVTPPSGYNPRGWLSVRIESFLRKKMAKPNPIAEQERIKANATAERLMAESQAQAAAELAKTEAQAQATTEAAKPKADAEKIQPKPPIRKPMPKKPKTVIPSEARKLPK
jgi:hypothetical protein